MARRLAGRVAGLPLRAMASRRIRSGSAIREPNACAGAGMMDTQRLVLLFVFGFSVLMLWDAWEKEHRPKPAAQVSSTVPQAPAATKPAATVPAAAAVTSTVQAPVPGAAASAAKGEIITVRTDLIVAEIDTLGASVKKIELLKHKDTGDTDKNFVLLGPEHHYEAQSGLVGDGPNHRTLWQAKGGEHVLAA
ncbi:MAG: membrane protein insertase YidC, partial [Burkholderiales bacterium]